MTLKKGRMVDCEICGVSVFITPSREKNKTHTCSRKCNSVIMSKRFFRGIVKSCPVCDDDIIRKPSFWKRIKGTATCSKKCRGQYIKESYKGLHNPNSKHKTPIKLYFANKYSDIKSRAKISNTQFDLTINDLQTQFEKQNGLCFYTKIPLKLTHDGTFKEIGQPELDILSVDKINPKNGYTKDNIVLCCNAINKMKGSSDVADFSLFLEYVVLKNLCFNKIKIKKLRDNSLIPKKQSFGDIGHDLYVSKVEDCGEYIKVYSGVAVEFPPGMYSEIYPRSSVYKKRLSLANSVGIIDTTYTGEIIGIFNKLSGYKDDFIFKEGERFAQMVLKKCEIVEFELVDDLVATERGDGGFGSTGV